MDQQTTYKAGNAGAKSNPNTVNGPWELQTVKSDHGTYLFRFNLTTGDCYSLDLRHIESGWVLVPSGTVIADAGVTAGNTKASREKVTASSI